MSENDSAKLVLVIVNYGSHELIQRNLATLAVQGHAPSVVIVDNFSSATEREHIIRLCAQRGWQLVASDKNLGFGGGVNLGVAHAFAAGAEVVVLLNPDAIITEQALQQLHDAVLQDPNRLVCPRIEDTDGKVFFAGALLDMRTGQTLSAGSARRKPDGEYRPWFTGACMAFGPSLWERIGGFDDDYFLYWEDVDLSFRAARAGAELFYAEDILVIHDEGGTQQESGQRAKSGLYYYYNIRNRLLFARKWLTKEQRRSWLRSSVGASREVIWRGGRKQLLQSTAPWKAWGRGLSHGFRDVRGADD